MGEPAYSVPDEEAELHQRLSASFPFYLAACVRTFDESRPDLASIAWPAHDFIAPLVDDLVGGHNFAWLKSRQMLVTWLLVAWGTWRVLYGQRARILYVSKREKDAWHLGDRARAILDNLPEPVRELDVREVDNKGEIGFAGGAALQFLPASEEIGRTYTATEVFMDEAAFLPFADKMFTALKPTLSGGGRLGMVSSPNGVGGLFHRVYTAAPDNGFTPRRVHWRQHPGRDAAWYAEATKGMTTRMARQEYGCDFLQSGAAVFSQEDLVQSPRPLRHEILAWLSQAEIEGDQSPFLIGVDVAEGTEDGDNSAIEVLHRATGRQVFSLAGRWRPDVFTEKLERVAQVYPGPIGIERNGPGGTVITLLMQRPRIAERLYRHREWDKEGKAKLTVGWATTSKSKPLMVNELEIAIRRRECLLSDGIGDETRAELLVFEYKDTLEHSGAPEGFHDDRVVALAIAWQMRKALLRGPRTLG